MILNLVLVPIEKIGINGAAWASVACHVVAFTIAFTALKRNIKLNLPFSKFVIKPIFATIIMGICSCFVYVIFSEIMAEKLATIIAIIFAIAIYALAIIVLKVFNKDEILSIPAGEKIYKILTKIKIY